MKKNVMQLLLALAPVTVMADDTYGSLIFQKSDGTTESIQATGTTITFDGTNATVTNGATKLTLTLSALKSMYFSSTANAIEALENTDASDLGEVEIYTVNGVRVDNMERTGVYIVKKNGKTYKQVVK